MARYVSQAPSATVTTSSIAAITSRFNNRCLITTPGSGTFIVPCCVCCVTAVVVGAGTKPEIYKQCCIQLSCFADCVCIYRNDTTACYFVCFCGMRNEQCLQFMAHCCADAGRLCACISMCACDIGYVARQTTFLVGSSGSGGYSEKAFAVTPGCCFLYCVAGCEGISCATYVPTGTTICATSACIVRTENECVRMCWNCPITSVSGYCTCFYACQPCLTYTSGTTVTNTLAGCGIGGDINRNGVAPKWANLGTINLNEGLYQHSCCSTGSVCGCCWTSRADIMCSAAAYNVDFWQRYARNCNNWSSYPGQVFFWMSCCQCNYTSCNMTCYNANITGCNVCCTCNMFGYLLRICSPSGSGPAGATCFGCCQTRQAYTRDLVLCACSWTYHCMCCVTGWTPGGSATFIFQTLTGSAIDGNAYSDPFCNMGSLPKFGGASAGNYYNNGKDPAANTVFCIYCTGPKFFGNLCCSTCDFYSYWACQATIWCCMTSSACHSTRYGTGLVAQNGPMYGIGGGYIFGNKACTWAQVCDCMKSKTNYGFVDLTDSFWCELPSYHFSFGWMCRTKCSLDHLTCSAEGVNNISGTKVTLACYYENANNYSTVASCAATCFCTCEMFCEPSIQLCADYSYGRCSTICSICCSAFVHNYNPSPINGSTANTCSLGWGANRYCGGTCLQTVCTNHPVINLWDQYYYQDNSCCIRARNRQNKEWNQSWFIFPIIEALYGSGTTPTTVCCDICICLNYNELKSANTTTCTYIPGPLPAGSVGTNVHCCLGNNTEISSFYHKHFFRRIGETTCNFFCHCAGYGVYKCRTRISFNGFTHNVCAACAVNSVTGCQVCVYGQGGAGTGGLPTKTTYFCDATSTSTASGVITGITITDGGCGYWACPPQPVVISATGRGFNGCSIDRMAVCFCTSANFNVCSCVEAVRIICGGEGYSNNDTIQFKGGAICTCYYSCASPTCWKAPTATLTVSSGGAGYAISATSYGAGGGACSDACECILSINSDVIKCVKPVYGGKGNTPDLPTYWSYKEGIENKLNSITPPCCYVGDSASGCSWFDTPQIRGSGAIPCFVSACLPTLYPSPAGPGGGGAIGNNDIQVVSSAAHGGIFAGGASICGNGGIGAGAGIGGTPGTGMVVFYWNA